MNVNLPPEWNTFVKEMVAAGHYADEQDLVVAGLRLLKSRESWRANIQAGIDQLVAGEVIGGEEVFAHLRERAKQIVDGAK